MRWSRRCNFNPLLLFGEPPVWLLIFDYGRVLLLQAEINPNTFLPSAQQGLRFDSLWQRRSNTYSPCRNVRKQREKNTWIKTTTENRWLSERQKINADLKPANISPTSAEAAGNSRKLWDQSRKIYLSLGNRLWCFFVPREWKEASRTVLMMSCGIWSWNL